MTTFHFDIKKLSKQILGQLRDGIPPYKSKKYLKWVKERFPDYEIHHILGSHLGRKNTDYLVVPLLPEVHRKIQKHYYKWIMPHLNTALLLLLEYGESLGIYKEDNEIVGKITDNVMFSKNPSISDLRNFIEKIRSKENESKI